MRVDKQTYVHVYDASYDEVTQLVQEYEKIYGHAAEKEFPQDNGIFRQFKITNDNSTVTIFHRKD